MPNRITLAELQRIRQWHLAHHREQPLEVFLVEERDQVAVLLGRVAWDEYTYAETSMAIGIPRWWYTAWLPALCAAIASSSVP